MPYKWLKWLILWIPTVTIGLWEYVRHTFLLSYISMDLGNVLAPLLVFLVTITLLRALFARLEESQAALQRERLLKAALEEREQLARQLHDGISQSLFLLSVKLDKLDRAESSEDVRKTTEHIRGTVRHVYEDVRQSIANLQLAPVSADVSWVKALHSLRDELVQSSGLEVKLDWQLPDGELTSKEKIELLAILREALMNVQKHARATWASVSCEPGGQAAGGFICRIEDDGIGLPADGPPAKGRYGIRMMHDRAKQMGWTFDISCTPMGTAVVVARKGN
ncbi:sensor histidine kinase [Paenibacillus sp. GCM10023252]|uniref:sensor histidine kinase n=1 Tax=Paenibacillus sp. GCM10023252 TaxID=3252649 RepID=UPI003619B249